MTTAQNALDIARSHIGYKERGRNWTIFGARVDGGKWQNQPWCGVFLRDVLTRAGLPNEPSAVYTPAGAQAYRAAGRWIPRNGEARPGDLVFYDWKGSQYLPAIDHVGIVESVSGDGVTAIEGNTQSGRFGNQGEGGVVARKQRKRNQIVGFGRPLYQAGAPLPPPPVPPGVDVVALRRWLAGTLINDGFGTVPVLRPGQWSWYVAGLQRALNIVASRGLVEDGSYGPATTQAVKDFQGFFGLKDRSGVFGDESRFVMTALLMKIRDGKA